MSCVAAVFFYPLFPLFLSARILSETAVVVVQAANANGVHDLCCLALFFYGLILPLRLYRRPMSLVLLKRHPVPTYQCTCRRGGLARRYVNGHASDFIVMHREDIHALHSYCTAIRIACYLHATRVHCRRRSCGS